MLVFERKGGARANWGGRAGGGGGGSVRREGVGRDQWVGQKWGGEWGGGGRVVGGAWGGGGGWWEVVGEGSAARMG